MQVRRVMGSIVADSLNELTPEQIRAAREAAKSGDTAALNEALADIAGGDETPPPVQR